MFCLKVDEEISLRLLEQTDAAQLFHLVDQSRIYLRRWLPWVDYMQQVSDYKPVIEIWDEQFKAQDGFQAGILYRGQLVGIAGFHSIDWANRKTSIGYWLGEYVQGYGIMTRVVAALVDLAFYDYNLNRVEISCGIDNKKSQAIPKRLGFQQEGMIRDGEFLYNHFHDLISYSILAREWCR